MTNLNDIEARLKSRMEALDNRLANKLEAINSKLPNVFDKNNALNESRKQNKENQENPSARKIGKKAVCVGLNDVSEIIYDNYEKLHLAGCKADAERFKCVLEKKDFAVKMLIDAEATCMGVSKVILNTAKILEAGDLFVFYISSHGGRDKDKANENWCLYDGIIWDEEIVWLFSKFKPGVRILVITDQCHSGGIFKGNTREIFKQTTRSTLTLPLPPTWNARAAIESKDFPMLIHFAACQEEQSALEGLGGGTWTQTLINVLVEANKKIWPPNCPYSYLKWFDDAKKSTEQHCKQKPQLVESASVTDDFRDTAALT